MHRLKRLRRMAYGSKPSCAISRCPKKAWTACAPRLRTRARRKSWSMVLGYAIRQTSHFAQEPYSQDAHEKGILGRCPEAGSAFGDMLCYGRWLRAERRVELCTSGTSTSRSWCPSTAGTVDSAAVPAFGAVRRDCTATVRTVVRCGRIKRSLLAWRWIGCRLGCGLRCSS
jgi:hypothetical protein